MQSYSLKESATLTPLVVSVPHAGVLIPDDDKALCVRSPRELLLDADLYTDRLCEELHEHAALITARISRYVLDLNRSPNDVCARVCSKWRTPCAPNPRALIWRAASDGSAVLARPLTLHEVQRRIDLIHQPYHAALAKLLERRRKQFGYAILLDVHSMPSRAGPKSTTKEIPEICPGDLLGKSSAPFVREALLKCADAHDLNTSVNKPYAGGYITRTHGDPSKSVHAIQIEVRRDLYMNELSKEFLTQKAKRIVSFLGACAETLGRDPRL